MMGRSITEDEAIEAAWNVQLPTLRLDMPLSKSGAFKRLRAERGDKAYTDMGVWLQLCSVATSFKNHALPLDYGLLAQWLFGNRAKSIIAAGHVNALIAAELAFIGTDGSLYFPAVETEFIRYGKMIVGGTRGGRPRGKKKRRR